jgi:putative membrane protein
MKTASLRSLCAPAVLALACGFAAAQQNAGTTTSMTGGQAAPAAQPGTGTRDLPAAGDDRLSRSDRRFLLEATESGLYEVQAAQLAAVKAADPQVKSYAAMLVDHHTHANNQLVQLANARKVELPVAPPRQLRLAMEQMGKKEGAAFDRDFVKDVGVKAHERDVKRFEKAAAEVTDPQLKAFAARTLPLLREHLAQARRLAKPDSALGNR